MPDDNKQAWIKRVLGIEFGATTQGVATPRDELLALFRDAKEDVDAQLNKLQTALRDTGDADLERIADLGLFGMTNGQGVGLMKALFELRAAGPEGQAAALKAARNAAAAYKKAVFSHPLADMVENNPFGVPVPLRQKLGQALDTIANAA